MMLSSTRLSRALSTTSRACFPRASQATSSVPQLMELKSVQQSDVQGIHRFDLDFYETAEWVNTLVTAMHTDPEMLAGLAKKGADTTRSSTRPVCIETHHAFAYDFTVPPSSLSPSTLHLTLPSNTSSIASPLSSLTPSQLSTLILLLGPAYSAQTNTLSLTSAHPHASHAKNVKILSEVLANLIKGITQPTGETVDAIRDIKKEAGKQRRPKQKPAVDFPRSWELEAKRVGEQEEANIQRQLE